MTCDAAPALSVQARGLLARLPISGWALVDLVSSRDDALDELLLSRAAHLVSIEGPVAGLAAGYVLCRGAHP